MGKTKAKVDTSKESVKANTKSIIIGIVIMVCLIGLSIYGQVMEKKLQDDSNKEIVEEYAKEVSKSVETYFTKHGKMPLDLELIDTDINYSKHSVVCDYRAQDNTFTLSNCVIDGNKYNDVYTSKEINK